MRQLNNFTLNDYRVVNFKERYTFWIHGTKIFFRRKKRKNVTLWSNYQLNHLPQVTESLTQLSNLTPQRATNLIFMWCRSRFRRKAGLLRTFLLFSPTTSKLESAVYSEQKNFCLALHFCSMHKEKTISINLPWPVYSRPLPPEIFSEGRGRLYTG